MIGALVAGAVVPAPGWAGLLPLATAVAVVGSGLVAGLFLAFSVSVMPALRRLPAPAATVAMQSINSAILNPVFGLLFGGSTVVAALVAVAAPFAAGGTAWHVAGGVLNVVGAFLVTVVVNVPLNNRLAALDASGEDASRVWAHYLTRWTAWNHARTVLSTAATVAFVAALGTAPGLNA